MDVSTFLDQYDERGDEIAQLKKNAAELMEVREQLQKEIERLKPFEQEVLRLRPLSEENEKLSKAVTACLTYLNNIKSQISTLTECFKDEISSNETK
jgi:phage host-nuclease inhibitor protein Gam